MIVFGQLRFIDARGHKCYFRKASMAQIADNVNSVVEVNVYL